MRIPSFKGNSYRVLALSKILKESVLFIPFHSLFLIIS